MTKAQSLTVFVDMAKALHNIGVVFAGPSSNKQHQRDIEKLRAIFDRMGIETPRMREALEAHGVDW